MKKLSILYLVFISMSFIGCIDDLDDSHTVQGRLISDFTGDGIENAKIIVYLTESNGSGYFSSSTDVYRREVFTDHLGNFAMNLDYDDDLNIANFYVSNTRSEEDVSTGILDTRDSFFMRDLVEIDQVVFRALRLEDLEIRITSTDPFDERDKFSMSILEYDTNYIGGVVYDIVNFADSNEPSEFAPQGIGQLFWISDHVDSVVYGHLKEGSRYRVRWTTTKNDVVEQFETDIFPVLSGELNVVEINY